MIVTLSNLYWTHRDLVTMTIRKDQIKLNRTPRYVSRETGAAELEISPETWDRYVKCGRLPPRALPFRSIPLHPHARAREHTGQSGGVRPALHRALGGLVSEQSSQGQAERA